MPATCHEEKKYQRCNVKHKWVSSIFYLKLKYNLCNLFHLKKENVGIFKLCLIFILNISEKKNIGWLALLYVSLYLFFFIIFIKTCLLKGEKNFKHFLLNQQLRCFLKHMDMNGVR